MSSFLDYYQAGAGLAGAYTEGQMGRVKMEAAIGLAQDRHNTAKELALLRSEQTRQKLGQDANEARKNAIMATDEGVTDVQPAAGLQAPTPAVAPAQGGAGLNAVSPSEQAGTPQAPVAPNQVATVSADQPRPTIAKAQWLATKARRLRDAGLTKDALSMDKESNDILQNDAKEVSALWADQLKKANADNDQARVTEIETTMRKANPLIDERMGGLHMKTKEVGANFSLEGTVKGDFAKQYAVSKGLPKVLVDGMDWKDGYYKFGFDEKGQVKVEQGNKGDKAPTVHSFIEGDKHIDKQWNEKTQKWDVVSSGPRYKPKEGIVAKPLSEATDKEKSMAKMMAEYKIPYPGSFALKSPEWQTVISLAEQIDPSFDATQYQVRQKVKNAFTSGKEAQNITGLNTAIGHLNSLSKAADDLANGNWQSANWGANTLAKYLPISKNLVDRQGKITAVKTTFNAVKGEMASIFKRSGATDTEIKSWNETVEDPTTATPSMWKSFKAETLKLMGSRVGALQAQYETGLGKPKDFHFLNAKSQKILEGMGVDINTIDPVTKQEAAQRTEVERRETASGKILVKYSDGSVEEVKK
jgi:hypothetical protein